MSLAAMTHAMGFARICLEKCKLGGLVNPRVDELVGTPEKLEVKRQPSLDRPRRLSEV